MDRCLRVRLLHLRLMLNKKSSTSSRRAAIQTFSNQQVMYSMNYLAFYELVFLSYNTVVAPDPVAVTGGTSDSSMPPALDAVSQQNEH